MDAWITVHEMQPGSFDNHSEDRLRWASECIVRAAAIDFIEPHKTDVYKDDAHPEFSVLHLTGSILYCCESATEVLQLVADASE